MTLVGAISVGPKTLMLAKTLAEMFEMCFNREWEDLPLDIQVHWVNNANELKRRMRDAER